MPAKIYLAENDAAPGANSRGAVNRYASENDAFVPFSPPGYWRKSGKCSQENL
jgi:hypothetical protein